MANEARAESDPIARIARMAAKRSPYAAGLANPPCSEGETTPGIKKLRPINLNM
jgi:hypothetical protein